MPITYLLQSLWTWIVSHGLLLATLFIIGLLIPRVTRRIVAATAGKLGTEDEANKGRKAIVGASVYMIQAVAYTVLVVVGLSNLGINLTAAAIPATVVSAAVGFGSQKIIGDLLGGFFIITEKQYGIGDWVKFSGTSTTAEGEVVDMTLRVTTIRTLNGDEVHVPNGEARMAVNSSSRWSRAVIVVPVPITAGSDIAELRSRTLAAAEEATASEEIAADILSEVTLQSVTEITPPTAMGLPWTATLRLLIDVAPGRQWAVERSVRGRILEEWWRDYGERAEDTSLLHRRHDDQPTDAATSQEAAATSTPGGLPLALGTDHVTTPADRAAGAHTYSGTTDDATTRVLPAAQIPQEDRDGERSDIPRGELDAEVMHRHQLRDAGQATSIPLLPDDEEDEGTRADKAAAKRRGWLSLGGRVRPSSTVLGGLLVLIGAVAVMSLSSSTGQAGWLSPERFTDTPVTSQPTEASSSPATTVPTTPQTTSAGAEPTATTSDSEPPESTSTTPTEPEPTTPSPTSASATPTATTTP